MDKDNALSAQEAIDDFRSALASGKKPVVVFVHPPKEITNSKVAGSVELFAQDGSLLHFVQIKNEGFASEHNYAPLGGFTPIAFSLLATKLKSSNYDSIILELSHSSAALDIILEVKKMLSEAGYCIIWGFTATSPSNFAAMHLVARVKDRGCLVCFGGSHATVSHEYAIKNCPQLDFIFVGDAENSFVAIMDLVVKGRGNLEEIEGITYRKNDGFHFASQIRVIGQELEFPDFEFLSYDKIPDIWGSERVFRIQGARGCKYRCSFCSQAIALQLSALEKLANYITFLCQKCDLKKINVFFEDATFTSDRQRTIDFCKKLSELKSSQGIYVSWGCQTRADCLDRVLIEKMSQSGCKYVYIGVEAMNSASLNLVRKSINYVGYASPMEKIENTLSALRENNVLVGCSIIVGLPTDNEESFGYTVSRLKHFGVHMIFMESVKLFPQTRLSKSVSDSQGYQDDQIVSKYYAKIENGSLNPEDKNCYLMREASSVENLYEIAQSVLLPEYEKVSTGLYVKSATPQILAYKNKMSYLAAKTV